MKDLYETLGVDKNSSAEDIKKSYRKLAVENHPDKGGNSERMKEITAAYNVLKDPEKRDRYDRTGETNPQDSFESKFRNMLNNVFIAIVDTESDVERVDLVQILKDELSKQDRFQRDELVKIRLEIEKLEKVLSRIKVDDGLIKPLVEAKIEQVHRQIGFCEQNIEFISGCMKRVSHFEYEVDVDNSGFEVPPEYDGFLDFIRKHHTDFRR